MKRSALQLLPPSPPLPPPVADPLHPFFQCNGRDGIIIFFIVLSVLSDDIQGKVKNYPHFRHNTSLGLSHCLLRMHA